MHVEHVEKWVMGMSDLEIWLDSSTSEGIYIFVIKYKEIISSSSATRINYLL